jgi:predicted RNA methylase
MALTTGTTVCFVTEMAVLVRCVAQIDSMYNDFEGKVVLDLGTGTVSVK